jgi:hypothetical protein
MSPTFMLAMWYSEGSLGRVAHSALPDAPVQAPNDRHRRLQWRTVLRTHAVRRVDARPEPAPRTAPAASAS